MTICLKRDVGVWAVAIALLAGVVCAEDAVDKRAVERAEAWERAALNRELAGVTQFSAAEQRASQAQAYRNRAHLGTAERLKDLENAASKEAEAGALCAAAYKNFTQAAANWEKAAGGYKKGEKVDKQMSASILIGDAHDSAFEACIRAAEAYERAAAAYGEHGADPARVAKYSEQAATWRERIAQLR